MPFPPRNRAGRMVSRAHAAHESVPMGSLHGNRFGGYATLWKLGSPGLLRCYLESLLIAGAGGLGGPPCVGVWKGSPGVPERISHGCFRRLHRIGNPADVCQPSSFEEGSSLPVSDGGRRVSGRPGRLGSAQLAGGDQQMSLLPLPSCWSPTLMWKKLSALLW